MKANLALITGATSGFGRALAEQLAAQGTDLLLTGRRENRLKEIKAELEEKFKVTVTTLCFDVSDRAACASAIESHAALVAKVDVLVNNAGLAKGVEPLHSGKMADWDTMIDTNIKGLLYMTRLVLPFMIKRQNGHIVNIGSVAGRWTYPGGGVYCATKFAVRALTDSLRLDLMGTGIRVTNIEPGMAETEFSEVRLQNKEQAAKVYQGMKALTAADVAETIVWCLQRPAHVNIQELVIFPTDQAGVGFVSRK